MSKPRNPFVEHARRRKGGAMSSRNEKRGGANSRELDAEELDALAASEGMRYRHKAVIAGVFGGVEPTDDAPLMKMLAKLEAEGGLVNEVAVERALMTEAAVPL